MALSKYRPGNFTKSRSEGAIVKNLASALVCGKILPEKMVGDRLINRG